MLTYTIPMSHDGLTLESALVLNFVQSVPPTCPVLKITPFKAPSVASAPLRDCLRERVWSSGPWACRAGPQSS